MYLIAVIALKGFDGFLRSEAVSICSDEEQRRTGEIWTTETVFGGHRGETYFPLADLVSATPIDLAREIGEQPQPNLNILTEIRGVARWLTRFMLCVQIFWRKFSAHGCTVILSSKDFRRHSNAYNGFSVAVQDVPTIRKNQSE